MTVKQLIAKLQRVNPDRLVIFTTHEYDEDRYLDDDLQVHDIIDIEEIKLDGAKVIRLVDEKS